MASGSSDTGATLTAIAALLSALTGLVVAVFAGIKSVLDRKTAAKESNAEIAAEITRLLAEKEKGQQ